jgi:uncharacterized protein with PQ loop repeat
VPKDLISVAQTWSNVFLGILMMGKYTPLYSALSYVVIVRNVISMLRMLFIVQSKIKVEKRNL